MYTGAGVTVVAGHPSMWKVVQSYNVSYSGVTHPNLTLIQFNSTNSYYKHK